ncbi:MAG: T9SS type A sorting domain-containing protein [Bacteroidota bacterium]
MTALRLPRRAAAALPSSPRSSRTRAQRRLHWLRHAAAAGTLTLARLHGTPEVQAQVASDPAGAEFQVSTFTTSNQRNSTVAMDADGDFVVVWHSYGQDGDGNGVFAQRYAADGTPQGSELQVNTFTTDDQTLPSVAMDADGNFVIAWQSNGSAGTDDSNGAIVAQRYVADGTPQGSEFQVNVYTTGRQTLPSVAMDADGDFVVVWQSADQDGDSGGVFAQRYDAGGVSQGAEFQVNTFTTSIQTQPSVAMDADGDFIVAWRSDGQDGDSGGVFAQRYAADGTSQGAEFQVNTFTTLNQRNSTVAMDADGDFVVAWHSYGQDGDGNGVFAQRYAADGTPQGTEFQVNTYTTDRQQNASVAMNADGDFVVAWRSDGQDGDRGGVFAQRYDAAGVTQGTEFQVNTYTTDSQQDPNVAMDADGDFVVAWTSDGQDGDRDGVYAQRYATPAPLTGSIAGAVFNDEDASTTFDETEDGLPGVTVQLFADAEPLGTLDDGDTKLDEVTTDIDDGYEVDGLLMGDFAFEDLDPGTYLVVVPETPEGFLPTTETPLAVTVGEGEEVTGQDIGFQEAVFDLALTTEVVYTGPGTGTVTATMTNTGDVAADLVRVKRTQQRDVTVAEKQIVVGPLAPDESGSVVFTFSDADEGATIKLRGQDLTVQGNEDDFTNNIVTIALDPPDLILLLAPDDEAPTAPSEGGSVWFTSTVSNTTESPLEQEAWVVLDGPGDDDSMVFGPQTVRLAPGQSVDRRFEAIVGPDDAPGTYTVIGRLGTFPDGIDAEDSFTFEKLGDIGLHAGGGLASLYAPSVGGPIWGVADDAEWAAMLRADEARKAALAAQAEEEAAALAEAAESEAIPEAFALVEPYPNPMSGLSSVRFELPEEAEVTVTLYDVLGRTVAVLASGTFEAGRHEALLDGTTLASGTYVVRFEAGEHMLAKPVTVLRAE